MNAADPDSYMKTEDEGLNLIPFKLVSIYKARGTRAFKSSTRSQD